MPIVLALDLSLNSTGWAKSDGTSGCIKNVADLRGMRRVQWALDSILALCTGVDLVVLEGYAFGAKGQAVFDIAEMGGVVRFTLFEASYPMVEIPPSSLKMFATGSGNAAKTEVLLCAVRKLAYAGNSDDEADALWLLEMTRAHYDGRTLPDKQRKALAKIQWPSLTPANTGTAERSEHGPHGNPTY